MCHFMLSFFFVYVDSIFVRTFAFCVARGRVDVIVDLFSMKYMNRRHCSVHAKFVQRQRQDICELVLILGKHKQNRICLYIWICLAPVAEYIHVGSMDMGENPTSNIKMERNHPKPETA